jgi:hypothetical protein
MTTLEVADDMDEREIKTEIYQHDGVDIRFPIRPTCPDYCYTTANGHKTECDFYVFRDGKHMCKKD